MNKMISVALATSAVLVGCGGSSGGSGPTPPPVYHWQMAQVVQKEAADVASGCIVYGEVAGSDSKVWTAERAITPFNILFHDADGTVIKTITDTELAPSLRARIDTAEIPDGGFVSLEEYTEGVGNQQVYMFSVQKEMLSSMTVNLRNGTRSEGCLTGSRFDNTFAINDNAVVDVRDEQRSAYFQTSYTPDANFVGGRDGSTDIPVKSPIPPRHDVLVTAFQNFDGERASQLEGYGFATSAHVFDKDLTPKEPLQLEYFGDQVFWEVDASLELDAGSAVLVQRKNKNYLWQYLYPGEPLTQFDDVEISFWAALFSGIDAVSNWQFESFVALDGEDISVELPRGMDSIDQAGVSQSCATANYCIDHGASFSPADFAVQRSYLASTNAVNNQLFVQTIVGTPVASQVIPSPSVVDFAPGESLGFEISLLQGDAESETASRDEVQFLLSQSFDMELVDSNYAYANGMISTPDEQQNLLNAMMKQGALTVIQKQ